MKKDAAAALVALIAHEKQLGDSASDEAQRRYQEFLDSPEGRARVDSLTRAFIQEVVRSRYEDSLREKPMRS